VLRETVERARAAGLEPALIELAYDLDRKEDLERLWNDDVALATVPATREALAAIFTARSTT
jgi:glycosyltransferase A (GT-A) superfamily protein (DUF2064 family)